MKRVRKGKVKDTKR